MMSIAQRGLHLVGLLVLAGITLGLLMGIPIEQAGAAHVECTVTVEPGESIQQALDAASENAVICLSTGTWEEHVKIAKSLTLRGHGAEATVLKGSQEGSSVIEISTEKNTEIVVNLVDLAVVDFPWDGVAVWGPVRLALERVRLSGNQSCGLDARDFARVRITKSQVFSNGCGIRAQESALVSLEETEISKNQRTGILISSWGGSAQLRLSNSVVSENGENGLEIWGPTIALITSSTISRNGHVGIRSGDVTLTVEKTLISENRGGGLFIWDSRLILKGSRVSQNADDGVLLRDNAHLQLIDSQIVSNNGWGIATMLRQCGWDEDLFSGSVTLAGSSTIAGNTKGELCLPAEAPAQPPQVPMCHITLTPGQIPHAQKLIDDVLEETVICLPAGEFAVNFKIAKSLTVRGSEEARTVLRPANPDEPVIVVHSPQPISVNLADLTLIGAHRESRLGAVQYHFTLSISGDVHVQLQRMGIVLSEQGVVIADTAQVEIVHSRLVEIAHGVMITGSARVTVRESHIAYGEIGIIAGYSSWLATSGLSEVHVERTRIVGMRGCALMASSGTRVSGQDNEFSENSVDLCGPVPAELRRPLVSQTERTELVVPRDYPTLQAAIDAIAPGGTILVERGVFAGAALYKDVTIRGAGVDQTVIRGVLTVCCQAEQVSLANFTVEGRPLEPPWLFGISGLMIFSGRLSDVELKQLRLRGGIGLMIEGFARVQGQRLTVRQTAFGLSVHGLAVVELRDSELSRSTSMGVGVGGNAVLILRNTTVAEHEGILMWIVGDSELYLFDSVVRDNRDGILVEGEAFVWVERSLIKNNEWALTARGQARGTVRESRIISNGTGIHALGSSILTVQRSVFSENSTALLAEGNATLWAVEGSQFTENDDAIVLTEAAQANTLKGNEIRNNRGIGIQAEVPGNILECVGNVVEGNEGGSYNESAAEACMPQSP